MLVQSRYFLIQFFFLQAELLFLTVQFFLGQLLSISEFVHTVEELPLILFVIVNQTAVLLDKRQLLFRAGHFITQGSDTFRIHPFSGKFMQQVLIHCLQQFIGFLLFRSNGLMDLFLLVTDQNVFFLHSLVTFLLFLTDSGFK